MARNFSQSTERSRSNYRGRESFDVAQSAGRNMRTQSGDLSAAGRSSRFPTDSRSWSRRPTESEVRGFLGLSDNQPGGRSDVTTGSNETRQRVYANRGSGAEGRQSRNAANFDRDVRQAGDQSRVNFNRGSNRAGGDEELPRGRVADRDSNRSPDGGRNWSEGNRGRDGARGGEFARNGDFARSGGSERNGDFARNGERGREWSRRVSENNRHEASQRIRSDWHARYGRDHDRHDVPFRADWWDRYDHGRHDYYWGSRRWYDRPYYWWGWASAPRITAWLAFGWPTPYYWDYGYGDYIYCADDVVYVNGRWFAPAEQFYEQTVVVADRAPDLTAEQAAELQWLPLGVFAMSREGVAESNLMVQLAVTEDGILGGTMFDEAAKAAYPLEGTVDPQTQRAVWSYDKGEGQRVVMETSIYNMTKPECTALVHFGPGDAQVWQMVRLEDPSAEGEQPIPPQSGPALELPHPD